MWERREQRLVAENNGACTLRGMIITAVPLIILLILFLSSSKLRASNVANMYLEIFITVVLVVAFQVTFFLMGMRWSYPTGEEMMTFVTQQYVREATKDTSRPPVRDERVIRLMK